jgi:enoyl-CoA hydratase/carnithine racemase
VIAAINGPAIGAGLCFALGTDVRIAATDAKLGLTFAALGLHPGMGATHFLPSLVGHQIAARLLLTAEKISGAEALTLGLVSEAVDADQARPGPCSDPIAVFA